MKTYLISGASGGIGRTIAEELLKKGNRCALVGRNNAVLSQFEAAWPETALSCSCDLRQASAVTEIFECLEEKEFLPLDGFVHCAGVAPLMRVDESDMGVVREAYAVNLFSFLEIMKFFVSGGRCHDGAAVVAISSVTAYRGSNRQTVYSGTKAALDASARCMAKELIDRKIRVNTIVSTVVETGMLQKLRAQSPNLDEKIKKHSPLGIVPGLEVCKMIEYLLSDAAAHITGTALQIDSGFLL